MANLEQKISVEQIVRTAGMVHDPSYYSGRGATMSDLNSEILESVYQGIQKSYGEKAAKNYTQMVADIPKLSATDFLNTLYVLEMHDWEWNTGLLGSNNGIDVGPDRGDGSREIIGMISITETMFGSNSRDDTWYIRSEFLARHGVANSMRGRSNRYNDD